jgi:hypothetical protein
MIHTHGVLLEDDAAPVVVVGTIGTRTVVDWVSVVTMIAGRVVVCPGAVVVTAVVVVVVTAVVLVSVVASVVVGGSASVRVRVGPDRVVAGAAVESAAVRVASALPLPPPPQAASAKPAVPATASSGPNQISLSSSGRRHRVMIG